MMKLRVNTLCLLFFCAALQAKETTNKNTQLKLQPQTCIVSYQGDECHLDVQASWQSQQAIDCCLYVDDTKHSCWQHKTQGEQNLQLDIKEDVQVNLVDANNHNTLAQKELNIQAQKSQRYRRRIKMPWSIF